MTSRSRLRPDRPARRTARSVGEHLDAEHRAGPPYHMTDMIAAEPALAGADRRAARGAGRRRRPARRGDPGDTRGGRAGHRHRLRDVRARRAGRRRDPARGGPRRRPPGRGRRRPSRRSSCRSHHRPAASSSGSPTKAARRRPTRPSLRPATPARRRRWSRSAAAPPPAASPGSWSRPTSSTTAGVTRSATSARSSRRPSVGAHLSGTAARRRRRSTELLAAGTPRRDAARRRSPRRSPTRRTLLVIASGADRPAGRELVLKVEEASWLPSAYRDLETFLHGHLPATDAIDRPRPDPDRSRAARAERIARARQALAAARVLGLRAAAIVAAEVDAAHRSRRSRPAGRLVVPEAPDLPGPVAALIGSATPLQLLTERLARARGTNPDPIRRDDPVYVARRGRRRRLTPGAIRPGRPAPRP